MAIKGSLREASLPDVIQLLALGRKSGCLAIADRQNFGYVWFDDGRITFASIVNRRDRLGDLLVRNGKLAPADLERAVTMQEADRERKLGEILVTEGLIEQAVLEQFVRLQIEEAVYFLFTWSQGTFNFEADVAPEGEDLLVSINPESLLLEGARRVDEWEQIEKKVPSFDLIFTAEVPPAADLADSLTEEQRRILPLLDGRRDVRAVIDESGLVEFQVGKALFGLVTAGLARRTGTSSGVPLTRLDEARVDEHRNLGIAFYKAGMLEEAEREFRRVADLRQAEGAAPFHLGLVAMRQAQWDEAIAHFRAALARGGPRPGVLHNLALALLAAGHLEEAEAAWGEAASRGREDADVAFGTVLTALARQAWEPAARRLERARELRGERRQPAAWYWAAGLAAASRGDAATVESEARAGLAEYPGHPVLLNALAVALEGSGRLAEAESALRQAHAGDASLPQVAKNLGDLLYRAGRYAEAEEAYARAARLAPDLGDDLYFRLGNIAYKRHDIEAARTHWERAVALNPGHELVRANLELLGSAA